MSAERLVVWRGILFAVGGALLATGVGLLLLDVAPSNYPGIAAWLALALVVNDGVVAITVFAVSVLLRRVSRSSGDTRLTFTVVMVIQGALVLAAIVTAVVIPEIYHQAIGTANPSVLPLDYTRNLVVFHLSVITLAALVVSLATLRRRRIRERAGPE